MRSAAPAAPLKAKLLGSAVFFVAIAPLSWKWGVVGAAIAFVLGTVANVAVLMVQLLTEYRRVRARMSEAPRIWVLMGHRRGDNNQLLALGRGARRAVRNPDHGI